MGIVTKMSHKLGRAAMLAGTFFVFQGCGDAVPGPTEVNGDCVVVTGVGQTDGDILRLAGGGTLDFDGVERAVQVALYLFDLKEDGEGGLRVQTQYQFTFSNGDSFLSRDLASLRPSIFPGEYLFAIKMTIVSGLGAFSGMEGERPLALKAKMVFTDPAQPNLPMKAHEEFEIDGLVCN